MLECYSKNEERHNLWPHLHNHDQSYKSLLKNILMRVDARNRQKKWKYDYTYSKWFQPRSTKYSSWYFFVFEETAHGILKYIWHDFNMSKINGTLIYCSLNINK